MSDLFAQAADKRPKPLAAELRPARLDDIVGQTHLIGPKGSLRRSIKAGRIGTAILYGPSGTGKTTIARAIGAEMNKAFHQLHPAESSVADIRKVAAEAKVREMLVFVDEIHRFNASQQDQLLGLTEDGVFDLIAATTSNPYFALTTALVSRATIYQLKPLSVEEMERVVENAFRALDARGVVTSITPEALRMLAGRAGGDARRALNVVEELTKALDRGIVHDIDEAMVDDVYQASPIPYDRKGDAHYDVVSAFIKSMRGSDPDATLYWLARLVHSGEDPRFIARRIMIHASEDVGLADPTAIQVAVAADAAVQRIGYPEAQITLAHAALQVALAPKSNSAYRGIHLAMGHVKSEPVVPVPAHLRDQHYKGAAKLGHAGYLFPHDYPEGWVQQEYAPGVRPGQFYQSDARANPTYERKAGDFWATVKGWFQPRRFED